MRFGNYGKYHTWAPPLWYFQLDNLLKFCIYNFLRLDNTYFSEQVKGTTTVSGSQIMTKKETLNDKRGKKEGMAILTYEVLPKGVLCDVLKEGGEDGEQGHCCVVDDLGHPLGLAFGVGELALLEVVNGLLQVLSSIVEEGP